MLKKLLDNIDSHHFSFIKHFSWIGGIYLSEGQKIFANTLANNRFVLVKKAKQVGATSLTCAHIVEKTHKNDNFNVLIMVSNIRQCKALLIIIKEYCERITPQNQFNINNRTNKITLYNNSTIEIILSNRINNFRGGRRIDLIYLDEYAFFGNQRESYGCCMNMLNDNSQIIIVSSPNTLDDYFYQLYSHNNIFTKHVIGYDDNPKNDIKLVNKIAFGDLAFRKEILGEFI